MAFVSVNRDQLQAGKAIDVELFGEVVADDLDDLNARLGEVEGSRWQGAWSASLGYSAGDLVSHNGNVYVATEATSAGEEPGAASPDPWDLFVTKGDDGVQGAVIGTFRGAWDVGTAYVTADIVSHGGSLYIANENTTGDEPGVASPDPWGLLPVMDLTLDDLSDVDAAAPNDGDVLRYQAGSPAGWVPSSPGWVLVDSWTHSGDVANVDFADLGGYSEIMVVTRQITKSVSGLTSLRVSVDNGSNFFATSGNYVFWQDAGSEGSLTGASLHGTQTTAARSGIAVLRGFNVNGVPKEIRPTSRALTILFVASTSPLNAIRIYGDGGGNLTGGSIYVLGMK